MVPSVSDSKYCADCGRQAPRLTPFRPHWHTSKTAIPLYCDRCRTRERERWKEHRNLDAARWAAWQTEQAAAEGWARNAWRERYRGLIRTEPLPPQGRSRTFVWELKPQRTLVTEYMQMPRYVKTNWT